MGLGRKEAVRSYDVEFHDAAEAKEGLPNFL